MAEPDLPGRFFFPFEGDPHIRTIMAYPSPISLPQSLLEPVRKEIAELARNVSSFEPVTMYVRPEDIDDARPRMINAENATGKIALIPFSVNHCWVRDTGPVYV